MARGDDLGRMSWSEIYSLTAEIRDELSRADDAVVRGALKDRLVEARAAIAEIESRWPEDGHDPPGTGTVTEPATTAGGGNGVSPWRRDRAVEGGECRGTGRPVATLEMSGHGGTDPATRTHLEKVLRRLQNESPHVEASALISDDGSLLASILPHDIDETLVADMSATILRLGLRALTELGRGRVEEVIVRGDRGYASMLSTGRGVLLLTLASEAANLGLIAADMREAAHEVRQVLRTPSPS